MNLTGDVIGSPVPGPAMGTGIYDNVGVSRSASYAVAAAGDSLVRVDRTGAPTTVATLANPTPGTNQENFAGVAISPDGAEWAYSVVTYANDASSATSKVYVEKDGLDAPTLIATLQRDENIGGHLR